MIGIYTIKMMVIMQFLLSLVMLEVVDDEYEHDRVEPWKFEYRQACFICCNLHMNYVYKALDDLFISIGDVMNAFF